MKKKIREKMIAISYDEHLKRKVIGILLVLVAVTLLLRKIVGPSLQLYWTSYTICVISILLLDLQGIIRRFDREFLRERMERNKLENIILSDSGFWRDAICWGLILPILIKTNLKFNFFTAVILIIVIMVVNSSVSKKVSNFFKKRLVE